jgi:hypothetical protein
MSTTRLVAMAIAALAVGVAGVGINPAIAQATRTWVSGVGNDANPCSRTAPCKTFAGAISKTDEGGVIECMDFVSVGTVFIVKPVTIECEQVQKTEFEKWISVFPKIESKGARLGYTVTAGPGEFGAINVIYTKEGISDEGHGLLRKKWDQRETINMRYLPTTDGLQPASVKRTVELKPPVGPWKRVEENTDVPSELLQTVLSPKT